MPTVLRHGGFRFFMWPNDHRPPHVHAVNSDGEVVIEISSLAVRTRKQMKLTDIADAVAIVAEKKDLLMKEWGKIHG
jgi:Domain of unknown function (DUF4160)